MTAFLPHFDPDPETRSAGRETRRAEYAFNHSNVSPLALVGYFGEPRIDELAGRFAARLDEIEVIINERNQHRRAYPFMLPSGVPQTSTSEGFAQKGGAYVNRDDANVQTTCGGQTEQTNHL